MTITKPCLKVSCTLDLTKACLGWVSTFNYSLPAHTWTSCLSPIFKKYLQIPSSVQKFSPACVRLGVQHGETLLLQWVNFGLFYIGFLPSP